MKINLININGTSIAEIVSDNIVISEVQDALDIMANCSYQGTGKIIVHQKNIVPDFFDLSTKLAGEILQKFSNYNVQLAIVGDFSEIRSKSLRDFIYESNRTGRIIFVSTSQEAQERLTK